MQPKSITTSPSSAQLADSVPTAAYNLGISPRKLYQLMSSGEIESFMVGKRRLVSRRAQEKFIRDRERESAGG